VHGVEKRVVRDSEALKVLKDITAKMDRVLAGQERGAVDLQQVGQDIPHSVTDILKRDLSPMAGDLASLKQVIFNDLPHILERLNGAAVQVGKVVEEKEGHIRATGQETAQAAEREAEVALQQEGKEGKWGWLILAGIGVYVLRNYLKQKGAEQQLPGSFVGTP